LTPPVPGEGEELLGLSDGRLTPENELQSLVKGRYQLLDVLGSGGMAVVYRARDTRLGQDRAIKVMRADLANESVTVERFEHEAMAMARVDHPNLVRVHDIGHDGPHEFMVMELVTGGSVQNRLGDGERMDLEEAGQIVRDVLGALGAAHSAGVVHRDIKPANVLLTDLKRAKVADFGVARLMDSNKSMTHTGMVLGTLSYMAPEQHIDARNVDGRADLYATGALLFAMLTGRKPYALHQEDMSSERLAPLPLNVRKVVYRSTRFKPEDRYPTASAMATDLRNALNDPEGFLHAARRRRFHKKIALILSASLLVSVLIVTMAWAYRIQHPPAARATAAGDATTGPAAAASVPAVVAPHLPVEPDATADDDAFGAEFGRSDPDEPLPRTASVAPDPAGSSAAADAPARSRGPAVVPIEAPTAPEPAPAAGSSFTLLVNSLPPSTLEIDGQPVGSTRFRGRLAPGNHELVLRADGYEPVVHAVDSSSGPTVRICWDFDASAPCRR
jgi:serine/threonine-protein kinase